MPNKTQEYLALAQRTANDLTRYWESWTDYLTTASRLYKYPFADQLMIYAQRPDATACADFDIWNNRMNRYVRRGSKGIALLDESSGFPRLHYVFDVSDTGVRRNSRDPEVWQYNDDLKQPVSEMLAATYGISGERVSQQLADVAGKLVADYWDNNGGDIRAIVDGSLLMDYDEAGVEMQFKSAAAMSVTYTLLERCGFEPAGWFDKDDFQAIYNFSTPDSVYTLGTAVSDMSREVLRNIERTVKTTMLSMGIHSLSAYIRKMALDGYCLNLDLPQLRRMAYLLQNCSNNLNQVAKRVNESGKIYSADLADLRTRLDELIDIGKQILSKLAEL